MVRRTGPRGPGSHRCRKPAAAYRAGPIDYDELRSCNGNGFSSRQRNLRKLITGSEPDNIIRAMHRNEHVLIKIHGDALDRSARVLTGLDRPTAVWREQRDKQTGASSRYSNAGTDHVHEQAAAVPRLQHRATARSTYSQSSIAKLPASRTTRSSLPTIPSRRSRSAATSSTGTASAHCGFFPGTLMG